MPSLQTTYVIFIPSLIPLHIEATIFQWNPHPRIIMDVHGIVYLAMVGCTSWNGPLQLNIHLAKILNFAKHKVWKANLIISYFTKHVGLGFIHSKQLQCRSHLQLKWLYLIKSNWKIWCSCSNQEKITLKVYTTIFKSTKWLTMNYVVNSTCAILILFTFIRVFTIIWNYIKHCKLRMCICGHAKEGLDDLFFVQFLFLFLQEICIRWLCSNQSSTFNSWA